MKVSMGPPPPRKHNPENPNSDPSKECQTLAEVARAEADIPAGATAGESSPAEMETEEKEKVDGAEPAPDSLEPQRQSSAVPYSIPPWSEPPEHPFFVEVLKDGAIIEQLDVSKKGAYMFGRIDLCDFMLEHPSISRFHAVLQFKQNEVFLFDIGSTHGTFINKNQVKKRAYVEVHVGDVIRFGSSSRLYVFQGPTELMPPEGDLERIRNAKFRQETLDREASLLRARVEATLADGISWGLSEDAIEESTEDGEDEVTWQTYTGQLTEKQEKTRGKILKRMEKIANMRKEIDAIRAKDIAQGGLTQGQQTQIARNEQRMTQIMEELESLEETLNESIQESLGARTGKLSHNKKRANAEDEDDLPSDDDDFYDRTKKKMSAQVSAEQSLVETAETLLVKKESIISQMEEKKVLLRKEQEKAQVEVQKGNNVDDLDAYMAGLSSQLVHDKIGQIQNELSGLQNELDRIMYLLKIADPTGEAARKREIESQALVLLPTPKTDSSVSKPDDAGKFIKSDPNLAGGKQITAPKAHTSVSEPDDAGKCIKSLQQGQEGTSQGKSEVPVYAPTKPQWLGATRSTESDENKMDQTHVEENESDNFVDYKDRNQALASKADRPEIERAGPGLIIRKRKLVQDADTTDTRGSKFKESTSQQDADTSVADAVALLLKHKRGYSALDGVMDEDEQSHTDNVDEKDSTQPKRVFGPSRPDFLAGKPDYESWMPPEGQTGDGRTSLNDRLGY